MTTPLDSYMVSLCAEPPSASGGQLAVTQTEQAVYDNTTGQLHVQLECGYLSSRGHPPVAVVWTVCTC